DQYGLPVPVVHYDHHDNSRKLLRYGLDRGRRIYETLGAEQVVEMVDVFPATHNMGTARMGDDPAASVCNRWGQAHELDNLFISDGSLFPTSGCANPTLTIIALALRQAEYLVAQIRSNSI
ncbi:MAG: GMC family oxidoreductase, partial [Gammaproteobacteria bacterium]|nr:GMC family oxidoreductase [Gammaproteobacteria bacterium]